MRSVMYKSLDRPGFQLQPASGFQVKSKFPNSMNMKHFKFVKDTSFRSALLTLSSGTNTNANRRNANLFHNIKIQTQTQIQIPIVGVQTLSTRVGEICGVGSQRTCNHFSALSAYLKKFRQKIPC